MCVESVEGAAADYAFHFMHISVFFMKYLMLVLYYSMTTMSLKFTEKRAFNSNIS